MVPWGHSLQRGQQGWEVLLCFALLEEGTGQTRSCRESPEEGAELTGALSAACWERAESPGERRLRGI